MLLRKKWRTELEAVDCTASYIRLGEKKSVVCGKELLWEHPTGASLGESEKV